MPGPIQAAINVTPNGTSPVAMFQQLQGGVTVFVQQSALVDSTNGTGSTIDANGLHVVVAKGTPNKSGPISNTAIGYGATATLASTVPIANGKTGALQHAIFASNQPILWTIQTVNDASTAASQTQFITDANRSFEYRPGCDTEITQASSGAAKFQATAQNLSTNSSLPNVSAYCSFFWVEN